MPRDALRSVNTRPLSTEITSLYILALTLL